ncbi:MAG TPA: hypothetical protein VJG29_01640 [Candidatus Paceibacterota bacterium]
MEFLKKNKLALAGAVALIILIGAYLAFRGGNNEELLQSTESGQLSSPVSRELLLTLSDLRNVTLDESLFSDPSFRSLVDFGVEIPLQPVGRRNPFAPLGTAQSQGAQNTTTGR